MGVKVFVLRLSRVLFLEGLGFECFSVCGVFSNFGL